MTEERRKVVDPHYAKGDEYARQLAEIEAEGTCPFCPESLERFHREPTLRQQGGWLITRSDYPYLNTEHHLLIIGEEHKESLSELTPADWQAISWLLNWAVEEFDIAGGGVTLRFGDTTHTGATVVHLHAHLIVPELDPGTGRAKVVNFPIG